MHKMGCMHDLAGTAQAALILGIDRSTLSRWVKDGRIVPALRVGGNGQMLFHLADVEALRDELKAAS